jgi:hypothetical protein
LGDGRRQPEEEKKSLLCEREENGTEEDTFSNRQIHPITRVTLRESSGGGKKLAMTGHGEEPMGRDVRASPRFSGSQGSTEWGFPWPIGRLKGGSAMM